MADDSYKKFKDRDQTELTRFGWNRVEKIETNLFGKSNQEVSLDDIGSATGYNMALYSRTLNGKTEWVLANVGTADLVDVSSDARNLTGSSNQYSFSVRFAKSLQNGMGGQEMTYVGHSLGGGLAAANGIHYFGNREYTPVNTTVKPFAAAVGNSPLFNGNISAISQSISTLGTPLEYTYSYDVLNRLTGMVANKGLDSLTNSWTNAFTALSDFKEAVTYDENGNFLNDNFGFPGNAGSVHFNGRIMAIDYIYKSTPGLYKAKKR